MGNLDDLLKRRRGQTAKPVDDQIIDAIKASGLEPPTSLKIDGQPHRFNSGTTGKGGKSNKPGWYIFYPGEIVSGAFGCWRSDIKMNFRQDIGRELTAIEQMHLSRRLSEAKEASKQLEEKIETASNDSAQKIWESCIAASADHPYLKRKKIDPNGSRVTGDGRLILPMFDEKHNLKSLQYIDNDGEKRFHDGPKVGALHHQIGTNEDNNNIYIAEGFATAATINEVTNSLSIVAYSASNIPAITKIIKEQYPSHRITIVADHDKNGIGEKYAKIAVHDSNCSFIKIPIEGQDANDYYNDGHDLRALLNPPSEYSQTLKCETGDFLNSDRTCIRWLIRDYVPRNQLIMVHGPSASGKSYVVIDWALRVATNTDTFCDRKVRQGNVFYMAGEGHHGMKARIQAWAKENEYKGSLSSLLVTSKSCQLETETGLNEVRLSLQYHEFDPDLIIVDTVNRFFGGDENSSQQVGDFIRACETLQHEYDCSVLLVHHTGVSDEAQHRPRGSSAWRASLDSEVSVVRKDAKLKLLNRKDKEGCGDAKEDWLEFKRVELGYEDEDGIEASSSVVIQSDGEKEEKTASKADQKLIQYKKICVDFCVEKADFIDGEWLINKGPFAQYIYDQGLAGTLNTAIKMCKPNGGGIVEVLLKKYLFEKKKPGCYKLTSQEMINQVQILRNSNK